MTPKNNTTTRGPIPTGGEILPNGVILDLVRDESSSELRLLTWNKDGLWTAGRVQYLDKIYVPANVDRTVLGALRLPTRVTPSASTGQLFDEICKLLADYIDLPERSLWQVVYFIFGTWLIDCVPIAPLLSIVAPAAAPSRLLLRLLALLCRRSLVLTAESPAGLWTLPMYLRPTLLLDAEEISEPVEKFLHASNSQGIYVPRRGQALDLYCAKAICSKEPLRDPSLASRALQITLAPTRQQRPELTREVSQEIGDEFQGKLLGYRLTKYHHVQMPDIDVGGLTASSQSLARSLAACIVDDARLQSAVVPLLRQQDQEVQRERSAGLESVILEALLSCCHDGDRSTVRAAELAETTNTILTARGESVRVSPESVGWRLKSLEFRTEPIGSGGKGLWLLDEVCAKIHRVAFDYGVLSVQQNLVKGCPHCLQFNGDAQGEEGKLGGSLEGLSELERL